MGTIRSCIAKHPLSGNEKADLRDIYADEGIKGIEAKRDETLAKMRKLYTSLDVAFPRPALLATPAPVEAVEDAPREERFILRDRSGKEFGYANEQQQSAIVEIGGWLRDKTSTIREYVLEGRGGTGKTTVLQKIIEDAGLSPSQVKYTATTNKAKAVLAKATGQRASTIWTALGIVPADEQYKKEGVNDEIEDLDIDNLEGIELIVIDEASMIGENMLEKILQKIEGRGIKVLYLGDSAQLPPIRSGREAKKVLASAFFGKNANSPVFNEAEYPNRVKLLTSMRQVGKSPILELTKLFTDVLDNLPVLRGSTGILIPKDRRVTNFSPATNSGVVFTTDEEFTLNSFVQDYLVKPLSTRIITTYNEQNDNQAESVYSLNREIFSRLHGTAREYGLHEAKDVLMAYTTVKFDPADPDGPAIWNGSEYIVSNPGKVEYIEFSVDGQRGVTPEEVAAIKEAAAVAKEEAVTALAAATSKEAIVKAEEQIAALEAAASSKIIIPTQMVTLEDVDSGVEITERIPAITDDYFPRERHKNKWGDMVVTTLEDRMSWVFSAAKKDLSPTAYSDFKKKHNGLSKLGAIDMHPAYAITAWKAQGSTYRNVYVAEDALNASKGFLSAKGSYQALYVALSRPTDKLVMYSEKLNRGAGSAASLAPKTETFPTGTNHSAQNTNVQEVDITEQLNSTPVRSVHAASKEELAARQEDYNSAKLPADLVAKIKAGKATTASMVEWVIANAQNPAYRELAKSIKAKIGKFSTYNAPVRYSDTWIKHGKYEFAGMARYTAVGGPSHIELSPAAMDEELVLHELLHLAAITNYNDGKDGSGTKAQIDAVNNLDKIASYIKGELERNSDKYSEYDQNMLKRLQSMRHSDELLTYGLTNKHAQRLLKGIQAGKILGLRKTGSVWAQFMTTIKQLLGLKDIDNTVLEQVLGASSILLTPQEQQAELSQENFSTTTKAIKVGKKIVDATAAVAIKIATELPKIVKSHTVMAELALGNLIKANNRAGVDLEGSTIDKLIKITQSRSGIFNIPAETFNNPDALASALVSLGVKEATAIKIVQHYQNYNAAYQQLRINDVRESSEILKKHGVPILERPLHLLAAIDENGVATLPPQVVLAMSISTSHWVSQNITDNPFGGDDKQKSLFLYGDMGHPLDPIDHENLNVLGLPHTETAAEVGMYIQKLMGMSAVSTRTQPYMESLAAAMGAAALEVLSTKNTLENNPVAQLVIDDHPWHFLNKDENGKFIVNTEVDREVLAGKDDRSFNHGTSHKHIKFIPGGTLRARDLDQIKAENADSNEVLGILGNHNDRTNSQLMLDTPETNVFSDIRGSFGKAPARMRSIMKTLQQVAWTTTDMIDTLGKLAESDLDLVHEIIGVVQYDEQFESSRRVESLKAANLDKTETLEMVLKAYKAGGLEKFYYTFRLMNQHRIMMRGEVNPQNSHVTRYAVKPVGTTTYTRENIHQFKYAIMYSLGYSVDKTLPVDISATFDEYMLDPDIKEAARLLSQNNPDMNKVAEVIRTIRGKAKFKDTIRKTDISMISGLTALGKYYDSHDQIEKTDAAIEAVKADNPDNLQEQIDALNKANDFIFESDVPFEIDGVSNGFAHTVMQIPVFENEHVLEKHLNQVAIQLGGSPETARHMQDGIYDKDSTVSQALGGEVATDPYIDLMGAVSRAVGIDAARTYLETMTSKSDEAIGKFLANYEIKNEAMANAAPMVRDVTRNLVKYPFMIFMYGGGVPSIARGVASQVIDDLYKTSGELRKNFVTTNDALTEANKSGDAKAIADAKSAHAESLAAIEALRSNLALLKGSNSESLAAALKKTSGLEPNAAFNNFTFEEATLKSELGSLLEPRFGTGLNAMLGDTDAIRKAVIQSGELLHAIFLQRFNIARKAYILKNRPKEFKEDKKTGKSIAQQEQEYVDRTWLSDKEIAEIVLHEDMVKWLPQFTGPLMEDGELVDLTKRKSDKTTKAIGKIVVELRRHNPQMVTRKVRGKNEYETVREGDTRSVETNTRQKDFVAPGVSALIRTVINFDAAALATALEQVPTVLMLYDAAFGRPEDLRKFAAAYNEAFKQLHLNNSIVEQMNSRVIEAQQMAAQYNIDNPDAADIMDGAKTWITEEAFVNRNTKDPTSFDELAAGLQTAADLTAERRKDLKAKEDQIHVQQMAIGDLSGTNTAAGTPIDEKVNQVNTSKELHRVKVLFEDMAESSVARLPQKVVDILEPLARSASAEYVVNMLSSFQPEHTGRYMDMMFAYEDAKDVSGGITDYALDLGRLHGDLPADAKRADLLKAGKKVIVAVITKSDLTYETDMGAGAAKLLPERTELLFNKYLKTDFNFVKFDSPFDAQIAEIMAEYNTPTKKELGTLENQRRTNPHTVLNTSIDATNVTKLFNKFKDMSRKYYNSQEKMDTHGVALERILESITKGLDHIDGISLEVEQVNGITQGRYFDAQKRVRVSLSRELPGGRNEYSPQEVYLHEMLHALTVTALEGNDSLKEEIHTVRKSVKTAIDAQGGYKIFLSGIPAGNRPTKREVDFAKEQYNYVFGAEARNVPEEFLAYALTNPSMIEAMQAHSRTTPDRGTTILGHLHSVLDKVVAFFIRAITRKNNPTSYEEMVAIAEQLMDIQVKHESVVDKAISKIIGSSDRADRKVAAFVAKKAMDLYDSDATTGFRKYTNAAIGLGVTQVTKNAAIQHASSEVYSRMHSIVGSTIKEMGDQGALTPALIKQLLHSLGKIGKLYQQFELDTVRRMSQQWKSIKDEEVGFKTRQAITRVMYRTDLSSLLDNGRVVYSPQQILSMIRNPASAETAKKLLIKQIGIGAKSDAIRYAEDLGYFISTNRGRLPQGHFNAHTIAQKYLTEEQRTPDNIHRLDAIATLASLEHQNSLDLKLVGDLMAKEFEANPNDNMFTYLLQSHRAYTKKSFKDLFHSNPIQMVKGYTSERIDNLTDMRTGLGDAKTARRMAREGYTRPYKLGKINGVPEAHTTMYISRYMPEIRHVSGIMSTTGLHHKGTLISEIIAKDTKFQNADGTVNLKAVHDYIKNLHKREERDAKNGVTHKDHNLRPLYDDIGNITDYRVIMNYESQEELFSPEIEFQDVFAHMESAYISKRNTVIADIQTVDLLVDEWVRIEPTGQYKFINIMDPNGKYHDRYRKLPEEVRNYMSQFTVNGEFLVREDIINKVFGYPAMDMSNISLFQAEMLGPIRSILRNVHYGLRKFMTFGMERIVMATLKVILNNVVSNALQLMIFQKIPPAYTARKMREGYVAFKRYEGDQQSFRDTSHFLAQATPNSVEHTRLTNELEALREQIEENPIHQLSELGVNSMLLEDVNTASREGFMSRAHQMLQTDQLQKTASYVPTSVTGLAKNMLLTRDSEIYKYHRQAVQLTDFLGRYVMISHAVEVKGIDFDTVLHEAIDAFVLFDENMHPAFEAINSMGFTAFLSYWLRITRPVRRYITRSPVTVGTAAGVQAITDVDTLAMMNGSIFGGKFLPNMWYMDDLADAATNIYGVENAITIARIAEKLIPGD